MMNYKELKNQLEILSEEIISMISEACQLVFQQKFEIQMGENSAVTDQLPEAAVPGVSLEFKISTAVGYYHRINFDDKLSLKLIGWMIQADPDEKLTQEQVEGLEEATQQIFGQLRTALEGMGLKMAFSDVALSLTDPAASSTWMAPSEEGIRVSYTVAVADETFIVDHCFWQTAEVAAEKDSPESEPELDVDALFSDEPETPVSPKKVPAAAPPVDVHPADFSTLAAAPGRNGDSRNINMLMDVELDINVELGKKIMPVKDVLKIGKGTIVELNKAAGEPLDLFVSGRKFAEGEVVVVDDNFGIRITALAGAKKRIEDLGK